MYVCVCMVLTSLTVFFVAFFTEAWEACMPELASDANGVACYRGVPFSLPEGNCTATVKAVPIS